MRYLQIILLSCLTISLNAQDKKSVYLYKIQEEIGPSAWRNTQKAVKAAEEMDADYLFIHMNTYGGLVDAADSIRTRLLNAKPTVLVFIDNNAASAGALIAIACDSIYMRKSASIGAATVVDQTGQAVPDKYQSYMRATMRATAESTGRDPQIAEAMVDPTVSIPGIIDSGKVLTFTSSEAFENGFSNGTAETIAEVLSMAGVTDYTITEQKLSTLDRIINMLISPAVSGILVLVIMGGIYFELQSPGVGFPLLAAVTAALLYFAPLYLEGLAAQWEILLFIVGLVLIALELFVIPGFGIAGIAGAALVLTGLIFSLLGNEGFNFDMTGGNDVLRALTTVLIPFTLFTVFLLLFGDKILQTKTFSTLVLNDTQDKAAGYSISNHDHLLGEKGLCATPLRPSGKVDIAGKRYDARAESGYLEKGSAVEVVGQERFELLVRPTESA